MIKVFFDQMLAVVFSKDFNFTSKVIVWAPDQLILADITMLLYILAHDPCATLVVTLDYFEEAALVMGLQILEHDDG